MTYNPTYSFAAHLRAQKGHMRGVSEAVSAPRPAQGAQQLHPCRQLTDFFELCKSAGTQSPNTPPSPVAVSQNPLDRQQGGADGPTARV